MLFAKWTVSLGVTYSTSSDHPIAVVGVQIAEAIDNANEANEANHDPDSVFISGNSKPCLIDILMFGTLRQLKELNSHSFSFLPWPLNSCQRRNGIPPISRYFCSERLSIRIVSRFGFESKPLRRRRKRWRS